MLEFKMSSSRGGRLEWRKVAPTSSSLGGSPRPQICYVNLIGSRACTSLLTEALVGQGGSSSGCWPQVRARQGRAVGARSHWRLTWGDSRGPRSPPEQRHQRGPHSAPCRKGCWPPGDFREHGPGGPSGWLIWRPAFTALQLRVPEELSLLVTAWPLDSPTARPPMSEFL